GNVDGAILRRASLDVRKLGVTIGGTAVSYGYDNASRLQTLSSANPAGTGFSATYAYAPNSHLVNTVTFQQTTPSPVTRLTTTSQYDFLNRLQSINPVAAVAAQAPLFRVYGYNQANQRTSVTNGDWSYWSYAYDTKGQVNSAKHYWYDSQAVPGQQFEFGYDDIGNRTTVKEGGDQTGSSAVLRQTTYVQNNL